jgi:hypothetical protein
MAKGTASGGMIIKRATTRVVRSATRVADSSERGLLTPDVISGGINK